ncbi:putative integrase/recombinase y4rB [Mesorhizobium sp. L-8-10]|uniref:tyrosine-type recombinase/integrase n=1 Tax=Mesorhizobium sp. L-8-10 TaxID=2744523 RepID=UPI001926D684|nr:tyrosine-type recombinase/integrase [Mesorhizobium sp. L-8-10]BCH34922.1 putative integrase/recombinase y4rB [Mesorhizobium sp. L-8-10]
MMLTDVVDVYLAKQRSLGMRFESAEVLLRRFCRVLGNPEISEITPETVAVFLQGSGSLSAAWMLRYNVLSGFYRFAVSRGHATFSPLPTTIPKLPPQQTPYVYSTEELRRLVDATSILKVGHSPQVPAIYRTLLLLLYGSGMRIGEALRLVLYDVDLTEQIITVRDTKFFKTRLVPIGPKLNCELAAHIERRRLLPLSRGQESPLFTTRDGRPWHYVRVISWFQHVRLAAGISCPVGELRPPRLHDIRHTAAVHRVIAWYRSGQDVQRLLPQLATYLGHIDIRSTQRYLHMTPDLLDAASQRFAQYAMGANHEG